MKKITNKQKELLIIMMEECAEVQKCVTKLLRFGNTEPTSLDNLTHELGDLLGIMEWVVKEFDINPDLLIQYGQMKQDKMLNWTSYQK